MKLGLINSAWAQAGKDTAYGIRMTQEIGFDTIDIFADPLDLDIKERRLIKRECDRAGLPIVSIACVAVGLDRLQSQRAALSSAADVRPTSIWLMSTGAKTCSWSWASTSGKSR